MTMKKLVASVAALAFSAGVQAAGAVPPAKQALVERVLALWQIDGIGQSMLQAPVGDAVQQARAMLQGRAAPEKRDAAMTEIVSEAKMIPTTIAPLLAERFTEDELRQMVAILESPVKKKFEAMVPELQKKLGESVAADTRAVIDPKLKDLQERIGLRLRAAVTP